MLFFCVEAEEVAGEGGLSRGAGLEGAGTDGVKELLDDQKVGAGVERLVAGPGEVVGFLGCGRVGGCRETGSCRGAGSLGTEGICVKVL